MPKPIATPDAVKADVYLVAAARAGISPKAISVLVDGKRDSLKTDLRLHQSTLLGMRNELNFYASQYRNGGDIPLADFNKAKTVRDLVKLTGAAAGLP